MSRDGEGDVRHRAAHADHRPSVSVHQHDHHVPEHDREGLRVRRFLLALGRPVAAYRRHDDESGQAIVIFAGGLIAILAVLALVIDTGNVWANQRMVQNGSDAAAEAGAVVMGQGLAGVATPALGWDATVNAQVQSLLNANGLTRVGAYYTDICGIPLTPTGLKSLNGDGSQNLATAAAVGHGIPTSTAVTPDCPNQ